MSNTETSIVFDIIDAVTDALATDPSTVNSVARGICRDATVYIEARPSEERCRAVITCDVRGNRNLRTRRGNLARICSNVLFNSMTGKLLAVPAKPLLPMSRPPTAEKLSDYIVYDAEDGTLVTLYYFAECWNLMVGTLFDARSKSWYDGNFGEIFDELAVKFNLDTNTLSKTCSYSFLIRHPQFHPVDRGAERAADSYGLWLVSKCDLEASEAQRTIVYLPVTEFRKLRETTLPHSMMAQKCSTALERYFNGGVPQFGLVFRAKSPSEPDYVHESSLNRRVKTLLYDASRGDHVDTLSKKKYAIVKAALSAEKSADFKVLFPSLAEQLEDYKSRMLAFRKEAIHRLSISESGWKTLPDAEEVLVRTFVKAIRGMQIQAADTNQIAAIDDALCDNKLVLQYMAAL